MINTAQEFNGWILKKGYKKRDNIHVNDSQDIGNIKHDSQTKQDLHFKITTILWHLISNQQWEGINQSEDTHAIQQHCLAYLKTSNAETDELSQNE